MKSNRGSKKATESYVGGHKQTVVDSQPAAEAAVSGDPHEEGFDFGHHVAARSQQQLEAIGVALLGGNGNRRKAVLVALVDVAARSIDFIYWSNGVARVTSHCNVLYLVLILRLCSCGVQK